MLNVSVMKKHKRGTPVTQLADALSKHILKLCSCRRISRRVSRVWEKPRKTVSR